jgi:hypothetical protein
VAIGEGGVVHKCREKSSRDWFKDRSTEALAEAVEVLRVWRWLRFEENANGMRIEGGREGWADGDSRVGVSTPQLGVTPVDIGNGPHGVRGLQIKGHSRDAIHQIFRGIIVAVGQEKACLDIG